MSKPWGSQLDFPVVPVRVPVQNQPVNTLVLEYPESLPDAARQTREEFERTMRFALASKLFELGKLSSGQAAALVPMDRYTFLHSLHETGVAAVSWPVTEWEDELSHA